MRRGLNLEKGKEILWEGTGEISSDQIPKMYAPNNPRKMIVATDTLHAFQQSTDLTLEIFAFLPFRTFRTCFCTLFSKLQVPEKFRTAPTRALRLVFGTEVSGSRSTVVYKAND